MGICSSCDSTSSVATAKLILRDGELQEVPCPVKVSALLRMDPSCFICSSDDMEFDDFVPAVDADDELLPGHLYFALPESWLRRRLRPEDMASLAVVASAALARGAAAAGVRCGCCGGGALNEVAFAVEERAKATQIVDAENAGRRLIRRRRREKGGRGRDFATNLSAVLEEGAMTAAARGLDNS